MKQEVTRALPSHSVPLSFFSPFFSSCSLKLSLHVSIPTLLFDQEFSVNTVTASVTSTNLLLLAVA